MRPSLIADAHPAKLGALLPLASLPAHLALPPAVSHQLAALLMVLVAGIYVGFAVQDDRSEVLAVEGVVALAFLVAALVALHVTIWAIPAAYAAHALWDLAHHRRLRLISTAMPGWYVPFCAVFDLVFAVGIVVIWSIG